MQKTYGKPITIHGNVINGITIDDVTLVVSGLPLAGDARAIVSPNAQNFFALWEAGDYAWSPIPLVTGAGAVNLLPPNTDAPDATILLGSAV